MSWTVDPILIGAVFILIGWIADLNKRLQHVERLLAMKELAAASGWELDHLAGIVELRRETGETDDDLRQRALRVLRKMLGDKE